MARASRAARGRARPARLLAALWRAFGGPFVRLGGLKLCNDSLNFAGAPSVSMYYNNPTPTWLLTPALYINLAACSTAFGLA